MRILEIVNRVSGEVDCTRYLQNGVGHGYPIAGLILCDKILTFWQFCSTSGAGMLRGDKAGGGGGGGGGSHCLWSMACPLPPPPPPKKKKLCLLRVFQRHCDQPSSEPHIDPTTAMGPTTFSKNHSFVEKLYVMWLVHIKQSGSQEYLL